MKYLGNKDRVTSFIKTVIENIDSEHNSALDLFAGTGSVSKLMSSMFNRVDSVDIMFLSKVLTHVKLNPTPQIKSEIIEKINNYLCDGFITNHYSEKVGINIFTEDIARHIDGALLILKKFQNELSETQKLFLLNAIVESADFRSNIMGSYESYYKKGWRKQALKEWNINVYQNNIIVDNNFYNSSVEDFLTNNKTHYDLVYCDSPYNTRQYSSVFHVPETICNNYEPNTKGVVNLPTETFKSKFSQKKQVSNSYDELIYKVSNITNNFLLSYSNEGLLSIEQIVNKLQQKFKHVEIFQMDYRKFNTNRKNDHNTVKEFIIYGKK